MSIPDTIYLHTSSNQIALDSGQVHFSRPSIMNKHWGEYRRVTNCVWNEELAEEMWTTGCGDAFTFIDGTPEENSFKHCPYCGGLIEVNES